MFKNRRDLEGNLELVQFLKGHKKSSRQHHCPQIIRFTATASQHTAEEVTKHLGNFSYGWHLRPSAENKQVDRKETEGTKAKEPVLLQCVMRVFSSLNTKKYLSFRTEADIWRGIRNSMWRGKSSTMAKTDPSRWMWEKDIASSYWHLIGSIKYVFWLNLMWEVKWNQTGPTVVTPD